jgi:hypothetical protein
MLNTAEAHLRDARAVERRVRDFIDRRKSQRD